MGFASERKRATVEGGADFGGGRVSPRRALLAIAGLAVAYFLAARLGLLLAQPVTPLWPATAIALAALLLGGRRLWPGIFLGDLPSEWLNIGSLEGAVGTAVAETTAALLTVVLVERFAGGLAAFDTPRGVLTYAGAVVVGMLPSPFLGAASYAAVGAIPWAEYGSVWVTWYLSEVIAALAIAPALLLAARPRDPIGEPTPSRRALAAFAGGLATASFVLFLGGFLADPLHGIEGALEFTVVPVLAWGAFYLPRSVVAPGLLVFAFAGTVGTLAGHGPFAEMELPVTSLQSFLAVMSVTSLCIGALARIQRRDAAAVRDARAHLEEQVRDRTADLARSLDALHASEERLGAVVAAAPIAVFALDAGGRFTLAQGRAFEAMRPGGAGGLPVWEAFASAPRFLDAVRRALAGEAFEERLPVGARRFDVRFSPTPGGGATGVATDVTERDRAEAALRDSEQRLEELADTIDGVFAVADSSFREGMFVSGAHERILGLSAEAMKYDPLAWLDRLHGDDRARAAEAVLGAIERAQPFRVEARFLRPDGRQRHLRVSGRPVLGGDGAVRHWAAMVEDVTEAVEAETALREHQARLAAEVDERTRELRLAVDELEALSHSMSHDLRGPLRALDGYAMAVLEADGAALSEASRGHLGRVRAAAADLGRLLDGVQEMLEAMRASLRPDDVDLSVLAAEADADLRRAHPGRAVETTVQPGLRARADPALLRKVLEHLLGNAWKFTSAKPRAAVTVGALRRRGETVYFVADDGAGFDPAHAAKLFRPFERLHHAGEFPGHGIGLAVVRRIVERHGGRAWAEGKPGQGAAVYFTLQPPPAPVAAARAGPALGAPQGVGR